MSATPDDPNTNASDASASDAADPNNPDDLGGSDGIPNEPDALDLLKDLIDRCRTAQGATEARKILTEARGDADFMAGLVEAHRTRWNDLNRILNGLRDIRGMSDDLKDLRRAIERLAAEQEEAKERAHPRASVWARLDKTESGRACASVRNVIAVLTHDAEWQGRIRYNSFDDVVYINDKPADDNAELEVGLRVQEVYGIPADTAARTGAAIRYVARDNEFHPVREYLEGLVWDRKPRLDTMLQTYLSAKGEAHLLALYGRRFLVQAVARVLPPRTKGENKGGPGCKADSMLILYGKQFAGKSTFCEILAVRPEWYSDADLDVRSEDAHRKLKGVWIYEVAECEVMFRGSEASRVKRFLSQHDSRTRPVYGKNVERYKRQTVFPGTTNEDEILVDPTGSRRFWLVTCGDSVNLAKLRADVDQLWAEAVHRYREGEAWHLTKEENALNEANAESYQDRDPWQDPIEEWLDRQQTGVSTNDALGEVGVPMRERERRHQMRMAAVFKRIGLERQPKDHNGRRLWWWAHLTPRH